MDIKRDLVAVEMDRVDAGGAGASVWWCGGGSVSVEKLSEALTAAGFIAPEPPSAVSALTRAMRSLAGNSDLSRMLGAQRTKGRRALVEEHRENDSLSYGVAMRAEIRDGALFINEEDAEQRPSLAFNLRQRFEEAQQLFTLPDISSWLVRTLWRLDAVSLRDAGGVYYLPPKGARVWEALAAVLRSAVGLQLYTMPTMRSAEAAEAIFSAVVRETQDVCADFAEQTAEGKLGARGLRARERDLRDARGKLERYEALLSRSGEAIHTQLDEVLNSIVAAVMLAESDEQAA